MYGMARSRSPKARGDREATSYIRRPMTYRPDRSRSSAPHSTSRSANRRVELNGMSALLASAESVRLRWLGSNAARSRNARSTTGSPTAGFLPRRRVGCVALTCPVSDAVCVRRPQEACAPLGGVSARLRLVAIDWQSRWTVAGRPGNLVTSAAIRDTVVRRPPTTGVHVATVCSHSR